MPERPAAEPWPPEISVVLDALDDGRVVTIPEAAEFRAELAYLIEQRDQLKEALRLDRERLSAVTAERDRWRAIAEAYNATLNTTLRDSMDQRKPRSTLDKP